jgi:hypothetical protein
MFFACVAEFNVSASLCLVALGFVDGATVGPASVEAIFLGVEGGGLEECVWEAVP